MQVRLSHPGESDRLKESQSPFGLSLDTPLSWSPCAHRVVCVPLSFGEQMGRRRVCCHPGQRAKAADRPQAYPPRKGFLLSVFSVRTRCGFGRGFCFPCSPQHVSLVAFMLSSPGEHVTALLVAALISPRDAQQGDNQTRGCGSAAGQPPPQCSLPMPVPPVSPLPVT